MRPPRAIFNSAVHLFLIRENQILLLRRFNTGYEDGKYSVPAGHLDGSEQVIAAAIREAREEIGVDISPHDIEVVGVMHRLSSDEYIDFFVACTRWSGEPANREPEKCDELRWANLDDLPANVIPYVRRAIANYRAGRWFDAMGWSDPPHASPPTIAGTESHSFQTSSLQPDGNAGLARTIASCESNWPWLQEKPGPDDAESTSVKPHQSVRGRHGSRSCANQTSSGFRDSTRS